MWLEQRNICNRYSQTIAQAIHGNVPRAYIAKHNLIWIKWIIWVQHCADLIWFGSPRKNYKRIELKWNEIDKCNNECVCVCLFRMVDAVHKLLSLFGISKGYDWSSIIFFALLECGFLTFIRIITMFVCSHLSPIKRYYLFLALFFLRVFLHLSGKLYAKL